MSAETEADRVAILNGALRLKAQRSPLKPGELRDWQADRRSRDPIKRLSREFDEIARQAVDPADLAAGMEAAGINDRIAREFYNEESVFRLAELVLELVPVELPDPLAYDYNPWRRPFWNHLSRGLLYALPTLPYVVAISFTHVTAAGIWVLLIACVISTAFTQGLAHFAHLFLGYGVTKAAVRVLRLALLGVIGVGGLIAVWIGLATGAGVLVAGIAYGVLLYTVAATVLMVFKRERLLLASLTPAILLSVVVLLAPGHLLGYPVVICSFLVVCVVAVVSVASWVLWDEARPRGPKWMPLARAEIAAAGLHALYGAVAAALMTFAVVDVLQFGNVIDGENLIGVGMLPLVVSLGFAEANVYGFRSECSTAMARSYSRQQFKPEARHILARRLLAYAATLVALTVIVLLPRYLAVGIDSITMLRHVAYGELGIALLGAMMLVSCGLARKATSLLGLGLVVDVLVRLPASGTLEELTTAHVVVFAGLIVVVWWTAFRDLVSPLRHR
jgi:hypothetical protein